MGPPRQPGKSTFASQVGNFSSRPSVQRIVTRRSDQSGIFSNGRRPESGARPRVGPRCFDSSQEAPLSSRPTLPDALLVADENEPEEMPPTSRRTSLGPFRYLGEAVEPQDLDGETKPAGRRG